MANNALVQTRIDAGVKERAAAVEARMAGFRLPSTQFPLVLEQVRWPHGECNFQW